MCLNINTASDGLKMAIINDIRDSLNKGQKIFILTHYGDAVKNITNDQEEAEKFYNVLPTNWHQLTYEEKAQIMRDEPKEIDFRSWSRQQWPYNSIRYAKRHNAKFIFIQSDYTYCKFPVWNIIHRNGTHR